MAKLKYLNAPDSDKDYLANNLSDSNGKNKREWSNEEISSLVGTVAHGAAELVGSFSWLKKNNYQDDPNYSYYPYSSYGNSGSSSLIWIIGGVAVLALVLFIALKN